MAWLVCGVYGEEFIFSCKPHRASVYASNDEKIEYWQGYREGSFEDKSIELPEGSIKKFIGRDVLKGKEWFPVSEDQFLGGI